MPWNSALSRLFFIRNWSRSPLISSPGDRSGIPGGDSTTISAQIFPDEFSRATKKEGECKASRGAKLNTEKVLPLSFSRENPALLLKKEGGKTKGIAFFNLVEHL